uniref:Transposase Tc1-like domain-containing protein n=1 Tax=Oncorhynchus tshawytscha TaxID=74940 RepID=A0AAZ3P5S7_ONCTS
MGISKSGNTSEKIVDLHKSGSFLGAISKCLKVPRSSVQTIVHKYKHHGTMQPSYRSGRRRVLSLRDERTLVRKVQINPRTTAKDVVKMLEETGAKVSISTVKRVLYRHNLKGHSARKKPLLQNHHKKARLRFATAHGDKDRTSWRNVLWSDETKIEPLCLEKNGGGLQAPIMLWGGLVHFTK